MWDGAKTLRLFHFWLKLEAAIADLPLKQIHFNLVIPTRITTLLSNLKIFSISVVLTGVVSVSPWCGNVTITLTVETAATSRSVTGNTGL